MKPPRYETRTQAQLEEQMRARARVWLPEWQPKSAPGDFLDALLKIAARFSSEVAQRLDRMPEKNFRGFLDWLGIHGEAGRAARIPVAFAMTAGSESVEATPPVQFQALGVDPPIMFETTEPLTITPAVLTCVVAADEANDAYFIAPDQVVSLDPPPAQGAQQLIPFKDTSGDTEVTANEQEHALYIGAKTALDLQYKAVIKLQGWESLAADTNLQWQYWSKADGADAPDWLPLERADVPNALYLLKPAGKMEQKSISIGDQENAGQWLRAYCKKVGASELTLPPVQLLLNCGIKGVEALEDFLPPETREDIKLEGIANTEPLVLNRSFYPLGREPRLFDSFYLGSKEVFSKQQALVELDFTMGADWAGDVVSVSAAAGVFGVAGITEGGALCIVRVDTSGAQPVVAFVRAGQPSDPEGGSAVLDTTVRPSAAINGSRMSVCVTSTDGEYWVWQADISEADSSRWTPTWAALGAPPSHPAASSPAPAPSSADSESAQTYSPQSALWSSGGGLTVCAVVAKRIFSRDVKKTQDWTPIEATYAGSPVDFAKVAPFTAATVAPGGPPSTELVGVSTGGDLYLFDPTDRWRKVSTAGTGVDPNVTPLAVRVNNDAVRVWSASLPSAGRRKLIAFSLGRQPQGFEVSSEYDVAVDLAGGGLTPIADSPITRVAFLARDGDRLRPAHWDAFALPAEPPILGDVPGGSGTPMGAPARIGSRLAIPSGHGNLWIAQMAPAAHSSIAAAALRHAVLVSSAVVPDSISRYAIDLPPDDTGARRVSDVREVLPLQDGRSALLLPRSAGAVSGGFRAPLYKEDPAHSFPGTMATPTTVEVDESNAPPLNALLHLKWVATSGRTLSRLVEITDISPGPTSPNTRTLTLNVAMPAAVTNVNCVPLLHVGTPDAIVLPSVRFANQLLAQKGTFVFPALDPVQQHALLAAASGSSWRVLSQPWNVPPAGSSALMLVDAVFDQFDEALAPLPHNPALSWEYWDGSSWWQIEDLTDNTHDLVASGTVTFCVPANIAASDVLGHNNFWIRARLVGGDYGQETVTIETDNTVPTKPKQSIIRSTDSIRAPLVMKLRVSYSVCCPITPDYVLTGDGGGLTSWSQVNASKSGDITAFVPLSSSIEYTAVEGDGALALSAAASSQSATSGISMPADDGGRAVYLGFDAAISGERISVLFLVKEGQHEQAFPLRAEILTGQGFEPVLIQDGTRGLSESGSLKLTIPDSPVQMERFGRSLFWIRLRPRKGFNESEWLPVIRSVYVNATWAQATETQQNELLGSCDGRPGLVTTLARTPVVAGSLRLRVLERLSAEQVRAMRDASQDSVVDSLGDRPGPWVLWKEVRDLLDAQPADRSYTFDDASGEVTFGDGINGMIPPVGRDVIIAESYVKGGGEAANGVHAYSEANLVTPVAGVEHVILAGDAAGGSDPEDSARTLRFAPAQLGQRERIITLEDFETAAVESSTEIAQAFARTRMDGGVDLFIVMRGQDPTPSASTRRELTRNLRARVAPSLAREGVIVVQAAVIVPIRVNVDVVVSDIDYTGTVADECARRIEALLDPEKGGFDGLGWPLGQLPAPADVSACLDGVEQMTDLVGVTVAGADGADLTSRLLRPQELASLMANGVRVTSVEETAV